jgi:hypothetical protein
MAKANRRVHKHFQLDSVKIKRAQKVLSAKTETIERALDFMINEHESNRLAFEANERFLGAAARSKMSTANWRARCERPCSISRCTFPDTSGLRCHPGTTPLLAGHFALAQLVGAGRTLYRGDRTNS